MSISLTQQATELHQQFEAEFAAQETKIDPATESLETIVIPLKKTNIDVRLAALAWITT